MCEVITFMVIFGVQNVSNVLNCEQKSGSPNDSYAITIMTKPFLMQTARNPLLTCLLVAFTSVFESTDVLVLSYSLSLLSH